MATAASSSSTEPLDLDVLRSRITELKNINVNSVDEQELSALNSDELLKDFAVELKGKLDQLQLDISGISCLSVNELDAYLEHLKGELNVVEVENGKVYNEIEELTRTYEEDLFQLQSDIERIEYSLSSTSRGLEGSTADADLNHSTNEEQMNLMSGNGSSQFKILELSSQIEKNERTLKTMQDLDCALLRFDALDKIEDALTSLKVIEIGRNNIRFSLRTYIPNRDIVLSLHKIEDVIDPLEQTHELVIELVDGAMELKDAEVDFGVRGCLMELGWLKPLRSYARNFTTLLSVDWIFPSDVYIGDIVDAAKSIRQLFSPLPLLERRSSLEWFVRKVRDRVVLSTLRRLLVKSANQSRHSFEYLERDEIIIAHMVGGVDAFIKVSEGWPIYCSSLRLLSLKSSSQYSREISLSFMCKVEEAANSLDKQIKQNLSTFVDAIEGILVQRMRAEPQSPDNTI